MDTNFLEECVANIKVRNLVNEDVEVVNDSSLQMIGKGRQGAVFQVTEDICVKVFGNTEDCEREYYALSLGQHTNLFPKLYHKGSLHIAMEIIEGVDLREYLQSQPLSKELSVKLIEMLITFKEIGYERIDHHKRQIYLQQDGSLKVIDVARTVWRDRVYPYPRKLLNSLGKENKEVFLTHVKELSPELYEEWKHYIRMDEIGREIYQVLLESPDDKKDVVKVLSDQLLTQDDEEQYVVLLSGLMHKVFKEQWARTMLARGTDPDEVIEKVDLYWDAHKLEFKKMKESSSNHDNETNTDGIKFGRSTNKREAKLGRVKGNENTTKKTDKQGKDKVKRKGEKMEKSAKGKPKTQRGKNRKWWNLG